MKAEEVVYRLRNIRDGLAHNDENKAALTMAASFVELNPNRFNDEMVIPVGPMTVISSAEELARVSREATRLGRGDRRGAL